jgi:hypothetical protein
MSKECIHFFGAALCINGVMLQVRQTDTRVTFTNKQLIKFTLEQATNAQRGLEIYLYSFFKPLR